MKTVSLTGAVFAVGEVVVVQGGSFSQGLSAEDSGERLPFFGRRWIGVLVQRVRFVRGLSEWADRVILVPTDDVKAKSACFTRC